MRLIVGMSGAGKTTLADELAPMINAKSERIASQMQARQWAEERGRGVAFKAAITPPTGP